MTSACPRTRPWTRVLTLGLVLTLGSIVFCERVHAQREREVLIDPDAADAVDPELWSTLQGLFRNIDLRPVDESSRPDSLVARVVLSPHENGVSIIVFDPRRADRGVRREVARGESKTVYRETVAQVLLSVVEPMAEREPPAPPQVPEEPPLVSDDSPKAQTQSEVTDPEIASGSDPLRSYFVGARTGLNWFSSDLKRPGFGAELGLRFEKPALRPLLAIEGLGFLSEDLDREGVTAQLRATSLRMVSMLELFNQRGLSFEVGCSAGADLLVFEPQSVVPPLKKEPKTRRVEPVISPRLTMRVGLTRLLSFVLGGALDVDLAPTRWAVARGRERASVFETSRARPQLIAALDWTFAGATSKGHTP